jgi:hypothetical protein
MEQRKLYDLDNTEDILNSLNSLEPKPGKFSAIEIVKKFYDPIKRAISLGYNYKELSESIFAVNGCKISARALKIAYEEVNKNSKIRTNKKIKQINQEG